MTKLTQEEVRRLLDYNPETGELRWRATGKGRKKSRAAGCVDSTGYLKIGVNGRRYLTHRLIWLWFYGYFPENEVDHIDRDPSNNRLTNLREASRTCNSRNCGKGARNTSGVKGVFWYARYGKWQSSIMVDHKEKQLARHTDFTEAVAHRLAAEQCLDWAGCDINSSAYQYMREYSTKGRKRL